MNKKEVTELKRRMKKDSCTITKMCGCYVDSSKNKVTTFAEDFLLLEDEEFYKYLEICSKALSGTMNNNLVELEFPTDEEVSGGMQSSLLALRESELQNETVLEAFYDHVIDTYDEVGNYLILLFFDSYDIPMKTTDNLLLGESDEVFNYVICAICPVNLSKPGLSFDEAAKKIAPRNRDWVVGATDSGFLFPCFTDRSTDIHHVLVYTKNAKDPHREFWENGLGCPSKLTSTEKRISFVDMMTKTLGPDNEDTEDLVLDVQQNIDNYVKEEIATYGEDTPVILNENDMNDILLDSGISERKAEKISAGYNEYFAEEKPEAEELVDARALKNSELRNEKRVLSEQVVALTAQLNEVGVLTGDGKNVDIVLKVTDEKAAEISSTFVDGRRTLLIPLDEDDTATINGQAISF